MFKMLVLVRLKSTTYQMGKGMWLEKEFIGTPERLAHFPFCNQIYDISGTQGGQQANLELNSEQFRIKFKIFRFVQSIIRLVSNED